MNDARRFYRRAQICAFQAENPQLFAERYRKAIGLKPHDPIPEGVSFIEMVNSIVDFEQRDLYSSRVLRAMAA